MTGSLTLDQIFDRLKADFQQDGKQNVKPASNFYTNPPAGLGYAGPQEFQLSFLNIFVNSKSGKARYNQPADNDVFATEVKPTSTVGNLALRIFSDQT
jgi:hypothetical protein